jgi:hypothetical protein
MPFRRFLRPLLWLGLWLGPGLPTACSDPTEQAAIAALGPEPAGARPGPLHRPGQPCVTCHGASGAAEPAFALAGTIYREKGKLQPLADVDVLVVDGAGRTLSARSNCAGNFWMDARQLPLVPPLWVTLRHGQMTIDMESPFFREGSCAACHSEPLGPTSAGAIYMTDDPEKALLLPETTCSNAP